MTATSKILDKEAIRRALMRIAHEIVEKNKGVNNANPDNTLEVNGSLEIEVENGDSKLRFHDTGNAWYSMGIDESDGGNFKINFGKDIGDTFQFVLTPLGDVEIGGTLTVKSNGTNKGELKVQYLPGDGVKTNGYYATYAP